jgi:streptogramin lyase
VSGYKSGAVLVLDPADGALVTTLPGLPGAQATRVHPDGRLLLVAEEAPGVYVADATTFEGLAPLILNNPDTAEDETGGLTSPTGVAFLAGEIVVGDYKTDRLLRYDAQGASLGVFAEGIEGLDGPDAGLVVGPEGDLWVPCFESSLILRLDASGAVVERVEGATNPRHLWFDAEGALWVSSWGSGEILRRDGGVFTAVVSPRAPTGFVVEPDGKAGQRGLTPCDGRIDRFGQGDDFDAARLPRQRLVVIAVSTGEQQHQPGNRPRQSRP